MAGRNGDKTNKSVKEDSKKEEEIRKEAAYSLNQVKDFLKIQEETYLGLIERLEKEIQSIREDNIRKEIEHKKEIDELKKAISFNTDKCNDHGNNIAKRLNYMDNERRDFGQFIDKKFAEIEDRSRRNNLRFDNVVDESENETWEESERKVKDAMKDMGMDVKLIEIERAHRVGSKRVGKKKHRTIAVKFIKWITKIVRRY